MQYIIECTFQTLLYESINSMLLKITLTPKFLKNFRNLDSQRKYILYVRRTACVFPYQYIYSNRQIDWWFNIYSSLVWMALFSPNPYILLVRRSVLWGENRKRTNGGSPQIRPLISALNTHLLCNGQLERWRVLKLWKTWFDIRINEIKVRIYSVYSETWGYF